MLFHNGNIIPLSPKKRNSFARFPRKKLVHVLWKSLSTVWIVFVDNSVKVQNLSHCAFFIFTRALTRWKSYPLTHFFHKITHMVIHPKNVVIHRLSTVKIVRKIKGLRKRGTGLSTIPQGKSAGISRFLWELSTLSTGYPQLLSPMHKDVDSAVDMQFFLKLPVYIYDKCV